MGIDLPIRTTCLVNYEDSMFTVEDYIQMSGRAGRRGYDTEGHVIFYNITDYTKLINSKIPEIIGSDKSIVKTYPILLKINNNYSNDTIKNIYLNNINPQRNISNKSYFSMNIKDLLYLQWELIDYDLHDFINELIHINNERAYKSIIDQCISYQLTDCIDKIIHYKYSIDEIPLLTLIDKYILKDKTTIYNYKHNSISNRSELPKLIELSTIIISLYNNIKNLYHLINKQIKTNTISGEIKMLFNINQCSMFDKIRILFIIYNLCNCSFKIHNNIQLLINKNTGILSVL